MTHEVEGLAVFWRIQGDLDAVRSVRADASCKVHGLQGPVGRWLLPLVAVSALSLLLVLDVLLRELAEEAQLFAPVGVL